MTDVNGNIASGAITATLSDGTTYTFTTGSSTSFIGFTENATITSLTASGTGNYVTVNDFIVGATVVPEPTSYAFLAATGLLFGCLSRSLRHNKQPAVPPAN